MTVGSKVVCVDGHFEEAVKKHYVALPVEGVTYTVRSMEVGISIQGEPGEICVLLEELTNPCSSKPPHRERGFKQERFRPLEEDWEEDADMEARNNAATIGA